MTSNKLLTLIYELSKIIPRRTIRIKEVLQRVELNKESICLGEIQLLLNNLEKKGFVNLTKSGKAGIIAVSLTPLGKARAE